MFSLLFPGHFLTGQSHNQLELDNGLWVEMVICGLRQWTVDLGPSAFSSHQLGWSGTARWLWTASSSLSVSKYHAVVSLWWSLIEALFTRVWEIQFPRLHPWDTWESIKGHSVYTNKKYCPWVIYFLRKIRRHLSLFLQWQHSPTIACQISQRGGRIAWCFFLLLLLLLFSRNLCYDPSILGGPAWHGS